MRVLLSSVVVVFLVAASGCFISDNAGPAVPCSLDSECPSDYRCAPGLEGARTCEVMYPPAGPPQQQSDAGPPDGGVADGGRPGSGTDAGTGDAGVVVPTWCKEIQPLMSGSCALNCHGATKTGSGRSDIRLDVYDTVGSERGAREMASRIKIRAVDQQTMPPQSRPDLTASEIALLNRWIAAGTPRCDDAGTP